jgi:hypothetical protein
MKALIRVLTMLLLVIASASVQAHKPSDSYLSMRVASNRIDGQWDIALRDLDLAIGIDADGNGEITWDEIRAKHSDIAAYALSHLALKTEGQSCTVAATEHLIDEHTDGAYAVMRFAGTCPVPIDALNVRYSLLFDLDPQHKGLLQLKQDNGTVTTAIFGIDNPQQQIRVHGGSALAQFADYVRHGIWHIWIGFDHILFLVSLLLPAVLARRGSAWQPAEGFRQAMADVVRVVSAFTVAHSITLTLAALNVVALPSRWVESAIAASVIFAALNNLVPIFQGRRWIAAFAFGLLHGFGFASVLGDLGLPDTARALALFGFNVGVELGQLAIVAAFLPLAHVARGSWVYRRVVFTGGSAGIAAIAAVWFIERAFNLSLA